MQLADVDLAQMSIADANAYVDMNNRTIGMDVISACSSGFGNSRHMGRCFHQCQDCGGIFAWLEG